MHCQQARWNAQFKGLAELERRCQNVRQEVNLLSERQEMLKGMVEDKIRLQSRATEKYYEQHFHEMELEEKKSREALLPVQNKYDFWRYQNERDEARRLQRSGSLRRMKEEVDSLDILSFKSCRSSAVDHVEEMSPESPRKMQDEQEVMSETSVNATRGRGEDGWRLEPETLETKVFLERECHHERVQVKSSRRESEAPGEEGDEVKSPKRKVIRVESEETQDYVRANDLDHEESEEKSFVSSAISVPQKAFVSLSRSMQ